MTKEKIQVILKLGFAGGSYTLFGVKSADNQWKVFIERNIVALLDLMPEDEREGFIPVSRTQYMSSIDKALLSLRADLWYMLVPMEVHPEFRHKISAEVERLGGNKEVKRWEKRLKEKESK